jgi:hypothetical protein
MEKTSQQNSGTNQDRKLQYSNRGRTTDPKTDSSNQTENRAGNMQCRRLLKTNQVADLTISTVTVKERKHVLTALASII